MTPLLTLLMPTRNRSEYLSAGVEYFLRSDRSDIQLIVCDGSDDHAACRQELARWHRDPRLTIIDNSLASTGTLSSMVANWSRALDCAEGRWVSIIGDDDICDPQVAPFLEQLERIAPHIEAVTWSHAHFDIGLTMVREAKIPMGTRINVAAGRDSLLRQAGWSNAKVPPTSVVSPYHGATRLDCLRRIRDERGAWFAFAIPDFDLDWSIVWSVEQFVWCERPFSITGVCPKSNSYSVRSEARRVEYAAKWQQESRYLDGWGETADPFLFSLPMLVLGFRNAFCQRVGVPAKVEMSNFLSTLANSLQNQEDESSFQSHRAAAVAFLTTNFGSDYGLSAVERRPRPPVALGGLIDGKLIVSNQAFGGDVLRFAEVAFAAVRPVPYLFQA